MYDISVCVSLVNSVLFSSLYMPIFKQIFDVNELGRSCLFYLRSASSSHWGSIWLRVNHVFYCLTFALGIRLYHVIRVHNALTFNLRVWMTMNLCVCVDYQLNDTQTKSELNLKDIDFSIKFHFKLYFITKNITIGVSMYTNLFLLVIIQHIKSSYESSVFFFKVTRWHVCANTENI